MIKKIKILSILLVFVIAFSVCQTGVFAGDVGDIDTLQMHFEVNTTEAPNAGDNVGPITHLFEGTTMDTHITQFNCYPYIDPATYEIWEALDAEPSFYQIVPLDKDGNIDLKKTTFEAGDDWGVIVNFVTLHNLAMGTASLQIQINGEGVPVSISDPNIYFVVKKIGTVEGKPTPTPEPEPTPTPEPTPAPAPAPTPKTESTSSNNNSSSSNSAVTSKGVKTGDNSLNYIFVIMSISVIGLGVATFYKRKNSKHF